MALGLMRALAARMLRTPEYHRACDAFLERLDAELTYTAHGYLEALCAGEAQYRPDQREDTFSRVGALDDQTRRSFLDLFDRDEAAADLCRMVPSFNRPMTKAAMGYWHHMECAQAIVNSRWFRLDEFLVDPAVRIRIGGEVTTQDVRLLGAVLGMLRAGDGVVERNPYVNSVIGILERQSLDAAAHVVGRAAAGTGRSYHHES